MGAVIRPVINLNIECHAALTETILGLGYVSPGVDLVATLQDINTLTKPLLEPLAQSRSGNLLTADPGKPRNPSTQLPPLLPTSQVPQGFGLHLTHMSHGHSFEGSIKTI